MRPLLLGERRLVRPLSKRVAVIEGDVWIRIGGRVDVVRLLQQLGPDHPLRAELIALFAGVAP